MSDAERQALSNAPSKASRLPSPGCLFAAAMLVIGVGMGLRFYIFRHHSAQVDFFEDVARDVETAPSLPEWM